MGSLKKIFHFLFAWAAYWYYGRPGRQLIVIGVTGTKGKTTTSRFIASVLEAGGFTIGLLNTSEIQIAHQRLPNKNQMTMLGRGRIQKYLKQMVQAGCQYAVIETSSEGILQYRHLALKYDIAVFTNLGTEHHERHGGFEKLKQDKGKLFASLARRGKKVINGRPVPTIIVANIDSQHAPYYLQFTADKKIVFSALSRPAVAPPTGAEFYQAAQIESGSNGVVFNVRNCKYYVPIVGDFNVYNALPAIAIGLTQGINADKIAAGLASVTAIAGRMEFINEGQNFSFIVDYAHEPMSYTALFTALRPLVKAPGKLVGIIGSDGGGRDVTKRGAMGQIAGRLCDVVVVTDVNPWDEDPQVIAEMLAAGARQSGKVDGQDLFIVIDRRAAIKKACELAVAGGVVAITAKGTESSIVVKGGQRIAWSDSEVAREVLRELSK